MRLLDAGCRRPRAARSARGTLADGADNVVEVQEPSSHQLDPVGKTGRLETTPESEFRSGNTFLFAEVFSASGKVAAPLFPRPGSGWG